MTIKFLNESGLRKLLLKILKALKLKQDVLTEGSGITISNNTISSDIIAVDPDDGAEEVDDLPLIGNTTNTVSQIYCEVRNSDDVDNDVLVVRGADDYLTSEYVPILLRKSTKTRGRGWHHYGNYRTNIEQGKSPDFVTTKMFRVDNTKTDDALMPVILLNGDAEVYDYLPQPSRFRTHDSSSGEKCADVTVSHGKRKIRLFQAGDDDEIPDYYSNFKAKWGLAFIKRSDFPNEHTRLDVTKLVTNIAPFYVYYRWQGGSVVGESGKSLKMVLLA